MAALRCRPPPHPQTFRSAQWAISREAPALGGTRDEKQKSKRKTTQTSSVGGRAKRRPDEFSLTVLHLLFDRKLFVVPESERADVCGDIILRCVLGF